MTSRLTTLLLQHRQAGTTIDTLPEDLVPADMAAAYAIQDETIAALGKVGAWKVSPMPEEGEPFCAPILASDIHDDGVRLDRAAYHDLGLEVEVAVTLGRNLPAVEGGYRGRDMAAAIASVHVAFELVASRFTDRATMPRVATFADLQSNGAVVMGAPVSPEAVADVASQSMTLTLDETNTYATAAGASTANVHRALAWLANHVIARGQMLTAGTIVITGARIGPVPFSGQSARAEAPGLGTVSVSFD